MMEDLVFTGSSPRLDESRYKIVGNRPCGAHLKVRRVLCQAWCRVGHCSDDGLGCDFVRRIAYARPMGMWR